MFETAGHHILMIKVQTAVFMRLLYVWAYSKGRGGNPDAV